MKTQQKNGPCPLKSPFTTPQEASLRTKNIFTPFPKLALSEGLSQAQRSLEEDAHPKGSSSAAAPLPPPRAGSRSSGQRRSAAGISGALLPPAAQPRLPPAQKTHNFVKTWQREQLGSYHLSEKFSRGKYNNNNKKNLLTSSFPSYYRWKRIYTSDNRCSECSSVIHLPLLLLMQLAFFISPRSTSTLQGSCPVRTRM